MRRTRAPDNAVALPAMADTETGGYYTAGPPATVFSADDANIIQEELVAIATMKGAALDPAGTTLNQCATAVSGAKAIEARNVEAAAVDSYWKMAVVASTDATVGEDDGGVIHAAAIASDSCKARGFESAAIASEDCNAGNAAGTSNHVAVVASNKVAVEGDESAAIASECTISGTATSTATRGAMVAASYDSAGTKVSGTDVAVVASNDSTITSVQRCAIVGGVDNSIATGNNSVVCGGNQNAITGGASFAGGGEFNTVSGAASAAIAASNSTVSGDTSAVIASNGSIAAGAAGSAVIGGDNNEVQYNATRSVIVGGEDNVIETADSAIVGSKDSVVQGVTACVILGSRYCDAEAGGNEANYMVCGGYDAATLVAPEWLIKSEGGVIYATNTTVQAADYAEMFPNADGAAHPPGRLLTRSGKGCKLARRRDRVLGVVSVNPTVLGNADPLSWQGTFLRDEWGAFKRGDVEEVNVVRSKRLGEDGKQIQEERTERRTVNARLRNPEWERKRKHTPRTQRPDEWTAVGLLGQLRVAVDATVSEGDFVEPGETPGIGTRTRDGEPGKGRPIECMEITSPFDEARGYAIALCLVG